MNTERTDPSDEVATLPSADPTGVPNLDKVLGGGILRGALMIIVGPPGSGKTTLADHMAFEAARRRRAARWRAARRTSRGMRENGDGGTGNDQPEGRP